MPFGRYTCGVQWHIVLNGVPDPQRKGRFGSNPQPKTCNRKLLLPPGEYEWGVRWTATPHFTKYLWYLLRPCAKRGNKYKTRSEQISQTSAGNGFHLANARLIVSETPRKASMFHFVCITRCLHVTSACYRPASEQAWQFQRANMSALSVDMYAAIRPVAEGLGRWQLQVPTVVRPILLSALEPPGMTESTCVRLIVSCRRELCVTYWTSWRAVTTNFDIVQWNCLHRLLLLWETSGTILFFFYAFCRRVRRIPNGTDGLTDGRKCV